MTAAFSEDQAATLLARWRSRSIPLSVLQRVAAVASAESNAVSASSGCAVSSASMASRQTCAWCTSAV